MRRRLAPLLLVAILAILAILARASPAFAAEAPAGLPVGGHGDLREVAEKVLSSVVMLHVTRSDEVRPGLPADLESFFKQRFREEPPPGFEPFLRRYFRGTSRGGLSLGSGVIIDEGGLAVTNAHVVEGAAAVTAELHTGERRPAEVVALDWRSDIAVVRVSGEGPFRPIEFAPARSLCAGDRVVAVGSPMGFSGSVTAGVVSHPARYLPPEIDYLIREARARGIYYGRLIQTDASINRGSSGGALADMRGRLVGMTVLLYGSQVEPGLGFGFAIPVEKLNRIVPALSEGREVEHGYLGIAPKTLGPELAGALGLGGRRGVVVDFVEDGSPASQAGLAPGEVILSMNGRPTPHEGDIIEGVGLAGAGAEVEFEVASPGGEVRTVRATLARRKQRRSAPPGEPEKGEGAWRGVEFEDHRGEVRVARVASGSPGARAGLAPGVRVNEAVIAGKRVKIESADSLREALGDTQGPVAFRTGSRGYVAVGAE